MGIYIYKIATTPTLFCTDSDAQALEFIAKWRREQAGTSTPPEDLILYRLSAVSATSDSTSSSSSPVTAREQILIDGLRTIEIQVGGQQKNHKAAMMARIARETREAAEQMP
jgi:hypothetical protein